MSAPCLTCVRTLRCRLLARPRCTRAALAGTTSPTHVSAAPVLSPFHSPVDYTHAYVACAALTDYGQNTKIRETLNNLVLNQPQEWQTSVGLPFV